MIKVYPCIVDFSTIKMSTFHLLYMFLHWYQSLMVEQIFSSDRTGLCQDHTDSHSVIGLSRHWLNRSVLYIITK